MSYRFAKVTTFYDEFLKDYYRHHPGAAGNSYAEQMARMMSAAFGWADFFSVNLNKIGVDAFEIVANVDPIQQRWAYEHGIKASGKEIVIAQLKELSPDIVMFEDSYIFNGEWIDYLREQVPSIKQVIGCCSAPYTDSDLVKFKVFDFMLTGAPHYVWEFKKKGLKMHLMYHAFEPSLLPRINQNNNYPDVDFIFLGSLIRGTGFHNTRIKIIENLIKTGIDLNIYTRLYHESALSTLVKQGKYLASALFKKAGLRFIVQTIPSLRESEEWSEFPKNSMYSKSLKKIVKPPIYGLEMFKALSKAKIGFNSHIDAAGDYAGNMRLFEATGVGSCLLTDWKRNLHELFEADYEVVTYKTVDECVEKTKWLLDNPGKMEIIAKAGQARVLRDHTYYIRALQLDEIIRERLKQ